MDKKDRAKWLAELIALEEEAGPVLAYTALMSRLKCVGNTKEITKKAIEYLPTALLCAMQNDECLQDIKQVTEKYPYLKPEILACASKLRKDKSYSGWTEYESNGYKDLIIKLENQALKTN